MLPMSMLPIANGDERDGRDGRDRRDGQDARRMSRSSRMSRMSRAKRREGLGERVALLRYARPRTLGAAKDRRCRSGGDLRRPTKSRPGARPTAANRRQAIRHAAGFVVARSAVISLDRGRYSRFFPQSKEISSQCFLGVNQSVIQIESVNVENCSFLLHSR